ncbi:hypothetical protein LZ554_006280 [Drepanopeziza brunnea f. sp. 'monogermtubi']|nr:hypothetical protein LZ554_006280 [Drepanopeziza brunnea f. sp. 'monogermtubi']
MTKTSFTTITPQTVLETLHDQLEAPVSGLYLREDVEIHCNFLMTRFVRKQFKDALANVSTEAGGQGPASYRKPRRRIGSWNLATTSSTLPPGSPPLNPPSTV